MKEGCLPACNIIPDIMGYTPTGQAASAEAVLCGFPCQGVSQAGDQKGLDDERSGLIKEAFKVFDSLQHGKIMLIENVGALLHQTPTCRQLVRYIFQARAAVIFVVIRHWILFFRLARKGASRCSGAL
ncbi:ydiP [Symbiodinium sp. KB8]|nr:ydiP [Symbiodinium sp. KB8]